jgi:hypothetical protein
MMMTAEEALEAGKDLTFEKVWVTIHEMSAETDRKIRESSAETDRRIRESSAETDRKIRESSAETDRKIQKMSDRIDKMAEKVDRIADNLGGLGRSMGELIETLIGARLWEKFDAYRYKLKRAYRRIPIYDKKNRILTDIDILLVNTTVVMAIEVKREPTKEDVDHHIKRMGYILKYPPAEAKGKKLLGALAGGVVDPDVRDYTYAQGFFVLELRGESVALVSPPKGFQAKEWQAGLKVKS